VDLIFLYGPPAAGKLTVAKALSELSGYKVFHNQLSIDLSMELFEFGTEDFKELSEAIRSKVFEISARKKEGKLIFTFCYAHPIDLAYVNNIIGQFEKCGGRVYLYQIICGEDILSKRVSEPSRNGHQKIRSADKLKQILSRYDLFTPVPEKGSVPVDTGVYSPEEAARLIFEDIKRKNASDDMSNDMKTS
jgi:hypothetical protein